MVRICFEARFCEKIKEGTMTGAIGSVIHKNIKKNCSLAIHWDYSSNPLKEVVCRKVTPIIIDSIEPMIENKDGEMEFMSSLRRKKIARADGFEDWNELLDFFRKIYGPLPLYGFELIEWAEEKFTYGANK